MIYFNIQSILFIPVTVLVLILIHFRYKFEYLSNLLIRLDSKLKNKYKRMIIIQLSILIPIIIGFYLFLQPPTSDVQLAMLSAIKSFLHGTNPYYFDVVPHILIFHSGFKELIMGTYNYGPIDLITYSIGFIIFYPFFGSPWWLFYSNIVLIFCIYLVVRKITNLSDIITIIPFMIVFSLFIQDNIILMCLFLSLAWWVHYKSNYKYKNTIVIILISLGTLTKLYLAFVLVGYFFYIFKSDIRSWIINGFVVIIVFLVCLFPFGILNVVKSIFIFHADLQIRANYATIQGGLTIYLMLFHITNLFIPIAILLSLLFLYLSNKYANSIELKFGLLTILNLILLPNAGYQFFSIPIFFLLVSFYNHISDIMYEKNYHEDLQFKTTTTTTTYP